jgi:membrane protein required for colicin V production
MDPTGRPRRPPSWSCSSSSSCCCAWSAAQITKTLHADGALGTLDRLMGLAFGLLRGLVVLGVFSLVFHMATPPDRVPSWMSKSALYPLSNAAAGAEGVRPKGAGLAGKLAPAIEGRRP